jgi:HPt (histidine-containing phosphotransfer) domain-containing protein
MNGLKWYKEFALEQAADDKELLEELLDIFKDSLKADLLLIEQGVAENSAAKVHGAAHSIKGAAASLGIVGINEVALKVEKDSREGGVSEAIDNLPVLHSLMAELHAL